MTADRGVLVGAGASVSLSVHDEQGYDNAYWDGTQLFFGDGDGQIFGRFTKPPDAEPGRPAGGTTVAVRRTGGRAGLTSEGAVDLDGDDDRDEELRSLVGRIDVRSVPGGPAGADRFVYDFDLCGDRCRVPEQHLAPDLRRVAELVLR